MIFSLKPVEVHAGRLGDGAELLGSYGLNINICLLNHLLCTKPTATVLFIKHSFFMKDPWLLLAIHSDPLMGR